MQILRQCEDAPIWCGIMEQILCHVKRDWLSSSVGTSREAPFEGVRGSVTFFPFWAICDHFGVEQASCIVRTWIEAAREVALQNRRCQSGGKGSARSCNWVGRYK